MEDNKMENGKPGVLKRFGFFSNRSKDDTGDPLDAYDDALFESLVSLFRLFP